MTDTQPVSLPGSLPATPPGFQLPCPCCGETSANIALFFADMSFSCQECSTDFTADDVRTLIVKWTAVLHWMDERTAVPGSRSNHADRHPRRPSRPSGRSRLRRPVLLRLDAGRLPAPAPTRRRGPGRPARLRRGLAPQPAPVPSARAAADRTVREDVDGIGRTFGVPVAALQHVVDDVALGAETVSLDQGPVAPQ